MGDYIKKTVLLDFLAMEGIDWSLHMTKNKDLIDGATKAYDIIRKAVESGELDADVEK